MSKLLGYRYCICEIAPGDCPWEQVRHLDHRDNLEDAQAILDVLQKTDVSYTSYVILLRPVWSKN